jgi:hypothetical protein
MQENKYPIGGYAPGNYHNRCCTCEKSFFGDKRATQCEPCALEAKARFDALDPNEKEFLIKRNARIANYMFSGPLTPERELIYRIVEQWGNAVEMPNMEQWLKDYAAAQHPGTAKWPLSVIDKATGTRHEVNKLVYHPENEPVPHVWCDTWYGHHIIGKDCEWYSESLSKEGNKERELEVFAKYLDEQRNSVTPDMWAEKAVWSKPNAFQEWLQYFNHQNRNNEEVL